MLAASYALERLIITLSHNKIKSNKQLADKL